MAFRFPAAGSGIPIYVCGAHAVVLILHFVSPGWKQIIFWEDGSENKEVRMLYSPTAAVLWG
jgi:hypothetical protein